MKIPKPKSQFCGTWTPPQIWKLFDEGKISAIEMVLLNLIQRYTKREEGCWASNEYFAKRLHKSAHHIGRMICRLKEIGLVFDVGRIKKGYLEYRLLETAWSSDRHPVQKCTGGGCKNVPHIISSYSKKRKKMMGTSEEVPHLDGFISPELEAERRAKAKELISYTPFDLYCAKLLKETIVTKLKLNNRWSKSRWQKEANQFKLIRAERDDDTDELEQLLIWYGVNASPNKTGLPHCYNAKQFRAQYGWVKKSWLKSKENTVVPLSAEVEELLSTIENWGWEKGSKDQLPQVVQKSYSAYDQFREKCWLHFKYLKSSLSKKEKLSAKHTGPVDFAEQMCRCLSPPENFIQNWFESVHNRVKSWGDWSGDLKSFTWKVDHKMFTKMGKQWSQEYCNQPELWNDFVKEVTSDED